MTDQSGSTERHTVEPSANKRSAAGVRKIVLYVILVCGVCTAILLPVALRVREFIRQEQCLFHMKQIGFMGMGDFYREYKHFPSYDDPENPEQPPCSWRVQLLPYIDERQLYNRYDRTQPWNSKTNIALERIRFSSYVCINNPNRNGPDSDLLAVVGPRCAFREKGSISINEITDKAGNTIMLVESANTGIHWMEPRDLKFEDAQIVEYNSTDNGIRSHHGDVILVGFCNGRIMSISKDIDPKLLKALMTIDGGESVESFFQQDDN